VDKTSPFHVPSLLHLLGGCVHRFRRFWLALGRLESRTLAHELSEIPVTRPIYVCGLARSGSTLLHEILSAHPSIATHRIKDYPLVYTPYWWRKATRRRQPTTPRERAHGDRVLVTSESPDALEEMVWMAFFPHCHDPSVSNVLDAELSHPAFESFYQAHLRKLLLAEQAKRYAAKANYHVARLRYLLRLFPDARILLPIREPKGHIASLMRQHERFTAEERKHPRALAYMQRSGHFEFGLDRRPINLGDNERVRSVERAWAEGEEVRGWARYWALVYDYLHALLAADERVRSAALVVRFEDLCNAPAQVLTSVVEHCALSDGEPLIATYAPRISRPDYYRTSFTPKEMAVIEEETAHTAALWGYS
jgi:hypothetical protein